MTDLTALWDSVCDAMKEMANDNDMIHDKTYDVTDHIMERVAPLIAAQALEEAATSYQLGGWAADPQAEVGLAAKRRQAEHAVGWVRARAAKLREALR